jgi:hypothetical protein
MRRASLCIAALLAIASPLAGAAETRHAKLTIVKASSMTVRGIDFHRGERVRVTVHQPKAISTRHVTATRAGTFLARFPNVKIAACQPWSVIAVGSRGSRATLVRRPACPPR